MKLSDFAQKQNIRSKRTSPVFNLNNDQVEKSLNIRIKELEAELKDVHKQLIPLKERSSLYDKRELYLKELQEQIDTLQKAVEHQTGMANIATEHANAYDDTVKNLDEVQDRLNIADAVVINQRREIESINNEFSNKKNQYHQLSISLNDLSTEKIELTTLLNHAVSELTEVKKHNTDMQNSNAEMSIKYIEDQTELKILRLDNQFLINDNVAARNKIDQTEALNDRLEQWMKSLRKKSDDSGSRLSAFEEAVQKSKSVMADMSQQIKELLADKERLIDRVHYITKEAMKTRMFNETGMLRAARLPTGAEAVHRQYIGHGKPTMLKFKLKEEEDDDLTV